MSTTQIDGVTVKTQANVYFDGKCVSHSLTLAEYQDSLPGIFAARDANGDGAISLEEMLAARQARIEAEQAE